MFEPEFSGGPCRCSLSRPTPGTVKPKRTHGGNRTYGVHTTSADCKGSGGWWWLLGRSVGELRKESLRLPGL